MNISTYNVTLTNANAEYTVALPAGIRSHRIQARTSADVRVAVATGLVAASTAPFWTVKSGQVLEVGGNSTALYFASGSAGTVVEILVVS